MSGMRGRNTYERTERARNLPEVCSGVDKRLQGVSRPALWKEGEGVKCGVCGDHYGDLMVKHAELCEDDSKAPSRRHLPEVDDLVRQVEEDEANA